MKVTHLVGGYLASGAGRAAEIVHRSLLDEGVESVILTGDRKPIGAAASIRSLETGGKGRLEGLLWKTGELAATKYAARRKPISLYSPGLFGRSAARFADDTDILHLHWLNSAAFTLPDLSDIKVPVVWTLHDMWPMTGGCHYALDCRGFETSCGACPRLSSSRTRDFSTFMQARKKRRVGDKAHVVAISEWIAREARASAILGDCPVTVIPNAVDTEAYFPLDRRLAREALGLDPDRPVVLTGHASHGWLKGSDLIVGAVDHLRGQPGAPDFDLIGFGNLDPEIGDRYACHFGRLYDDVTLRLLYCAADVFIAASRFEAFGRTLIEALACGTPVVAFAGTGPDDILTSPEIGYLAEAENPQDLAEGIRRLLRTGPDSRDACRTRAVSVYGCKRIAQQHMALYSDLLEA